MITLLMLGLLVKSFTWTLRIPGLFLLQICLKDQLKSFIPLLLEVQDVAGYVPHLYLSLLAMFLIFLPVEELLKLYVKIFQEAACFFCVFFLYNFLEDELKASLESLLEESIFRFLLKTLLNGTMVMLLSLYLIRCLTAPLQYYYKRIVDLLSTIGEFLEQVPERVNALMAMPQEESSQRTWNWVRKSEDFFSAFSGYLDLQFLVEVITAALQQEELIEQGAWGRLVAVSLAQTLNSPFMIYTFATRINRTFVSNILKFSHLLISPSGEFSLKRLQSNFDLHYNLFWLGVGTTLLNIEMLERVEAIRIFPVLMVAILLQSLLEITQPFLHSLPGTSWTKGNIGKHLFLLLLHLTILVTPLFMIHLVIPPGRSDLWTLAICSRCLMTTVQSLALLTSYIITTWDGFRRSPSPHTDDYIKYVETLSETVKLLLASVVMLSGFYRSFVVDSLLHWPILNFLLIFLNFIGSIFGPAGHNYMEYREISRRFSSMATASESELREKQNKTKVTTEY